MSEPLSTEKLAGLKFPVDYKDLSKGYKIIKSARHLENAAGMELTFEDGTTQKIGLASLWSVQNEGKYQDL